VIGVLSGCNTWVGKQYVNTVARYNRIYHSEKQIRSTDKTVKESFVDDFNKTLPILNLGNESSLKGNGGDMDNVLKKTSRVIEKFPKSKWTDNAWFLMGQSYFYRGDFFAAIETFEFVSSKYKKTNIAYQANLWTLYSYILMVKESESLAIISKLKNEKLFPKEYKKGLYACAADIAIKQDKPTLAIDNLLLAMPFVKKKDEKIRYNFILAQLYQNADSFEKATYHYKKVIKYNPPYDFNFNAQINMASSLVQSEGQSYKKAKSLLNTMLKDDKNIDYYSRIYYELGKVDELSNNTKSALSNYKQSIHEKGNTNIIRTNAYNAIGTIYFNQKNYLIADKYFDSANQTLDQSHPKFSELSKKRENQSELLNHLVTIQTNDSLLMLAKNPTKLENEIDRQIELEKRRLKALEIEKLKSNNSLPPSMTNNPFPTPNNNNTAIASANASFPFYDPTLRARGMNDFKAKWGDRVLNDNWRVSAIASNSIDDPINDPTKDSTKTKDTTKVILNQAVPSNISEDRKKYYLSIPYTQSQKNQLNKENELALFELGILHLYSLDLPEQGISYLEQLQKRYPNHPNEPRTFFELAKYYKDVGRSDDYNAYYDKLVRTYPNSNFLKVLKNEIIADNESSKNNVSKEVQDLYDQAYRSYKTGKYKNVLLIKEQYDSKYAGNALQSNFEYIEALTYARMKRMDDYKKKLELIIANYPNTLVSENASRNLLFIKSETSQDSGSTVKSTTKKDEYSLDKNAPHFSMLVFPLKSTTNKIKNTLNDYHKRNYSLKNIEVTEMVLGQYKCIIIKGFENLKENQDYMNVLKAKEILGKESKLEELVPISAKNLGSLLKLGELDNYLKFANMQYKS